MEEQEPRRESIPERARKRATKAVKSKWGRRIIRAIGLTILFFVGSAIYLSQTDWGEERMGRLAVEAIHDQLGLDASFEDIEVIWGWWPPSLTVEADGIELDHPEEGSFASAESLVIRPSLSALVSGDLDLQTIELHSPNVRLRVRDGAVVNLPELPESDGGGAIELPFEGLEINDGRIEVDASPLIVAEVHGLDLSLTANGDELGFTLTTEGGEVRHEAGTEPILELAMSGEADLDESVTLDELQLTTPDLGLTLHGGELGFGGDELAYAGHLVGHFDVAHVADLPLGVELPALEGRVAIEADVSMNEGVPHGRGVLQLLGVKVADRYQIGESVALQLEATPERIEILEGSQARLPYDGGTVELDGGLDLDPERGFPIEVHVAYDFQFAKLIHMLGVTPDTPVWWPMVGEATLSGTLDPVLIDGPVQVSTQNFLVTVGPHHARPRERIIGVRRGRVHGRWHIDAEAVEFRNLTLDTNGSHVRVPVVHLGYAGDLRIEAHAERLDLADLTPLTDNIALAGTGSVDVTIGTTFDEPHVQGHANLRGFQFDTMRFGDLESDFRIRDDYYGVILPLVTASKPGSSYRVHDLEVDLTDGVEVTGQLQASRLSLQDVYHVFQLDRDERFTPYQGMARGHMGIHFRYGQAGQTAEGTFVSDMDFELLSAELAGYAFDRGRFQGHLDWQDIGQSIDGAVLTIQHFGLRKEQGSVALQGQIRRNTELQLTVAADQIAIAKTEGISESMPQLRGSYSVLGTIGGTADLPRMDLDVMLTGLGWGDALLGDGRAYVRLTDPSDPWVAQAKEWSTIPEDESCAHARHGLAHADWRPGPDIRTQTGTIARSRTPQAFLVCGEGLDGQLLVDMALGWTPVYPTRGVIDLHQLDFAPFLEGTLDERVHGGVDGRIALTGGAMLQDRSLDGEIRLERFELKSEGLGGSDATLGVWNEEPIVIALQSGGAEIERLRLESNAESAFQARGRISSRGRLDLALDGELHLGVLALISEDISGSSGTIRMHVDVGGPMGNPAVYGEARLRGGGLTTADGSRIRRLRGDVRFDARNILFTDFEGQLGGGRLSASGAANLENGALTRYTFELAMRNAVFVPEEGVEVGFDGRAQIGWTQGQRLPLLSGNIQLGRVSYRRPIQLSPTLGQLYRPQVTQVERYDPQDDNVELDVRIETRTPVRVTNNLLDVTLDVDDQDRPFRIVGTDQRWGVVGDLAIPQGTVRFRNTELSVADGDITFDDPTRIDPHFDVTATTEIRRQASASDLTAPAWRVRLHAHGTMDAFRIDASSTPSLSQEDLMLLLTVGMTTAEAQQLQAGDVGGTALEALSALSGVNEEVTSAVGIIDDFAVTTRYSPNTGRPEPMLTVGKRITERVRLSAATGLSGDDRTFQAGAEMRMGDQTSMRIQYDNVNRESASNVGNVGVDFHWRLEFE